MATKEVSGQGAAVPNNNTGVIVNAGGNDGSYVTDLSPVDIGIDLGDTNRLVLSSGNQGAGSDRAGLKQADVAYALGYQTDGGDPRHDFIMRGTTTKIGGVANTTILFGGSIVATNDGIGTVRTVVSTRRVGEHSSTAFDMLARPSTVISPGLTRGANAGDLSTMVNPEDGTNAVAAEIDGSKTVPAELTFRTGAALPLTSSYALE